MLYFLCAVFLLKPVIGQQICLNGGNVAPCLPDNSCPVPGTTCIPGVPFGSCCNNSMVYPPLTTTTTKPTTTTLPCFDLINPSTGVSDCPQRTSYCSNAVYYDVMTTQCPRTCGRCGVTTSKPCFDQINPKTGTSDCPGLLAYCTNSVYLTLMKDQCPRTCGYCTSG